MNISTINIVVYYPHMHELYPILKYAPYDLSAAHAACVGLSITWSGVHLYLCRAIVIPILRDYEPDIILVSAGFNATNGHPPTLGGYSLTPKCEGWHINLNCIFLHMSTCFLLTMLHIQYLFVYVVAKGISSVQLYCITRALYFVQLLVVHIMWNML